MKMPIRIISVMILMIMTGYEINGQIQFKQTIGSQNDEYPSNILKTNDDTYILAVNSHVNVNDSSFTTCFSLSEEGEILNQKAISKSDTSTKILNIITSYEDNHYFAVGELQSGNKAWLWLFKMNEEFIIEWEHTSQIENPNFISIGRAYAQKKDFNYFIAYDITNSDFPVTRMAKYTPENDSLVISDWEMSGGNLGDFERNKHNDNFLLGGDMLVRNFTRIWEVNTDLELQTSYDSLQHDIYHMLDLEWLNDDRLIHSGSFYNDQYEYTRFMGIQTLDSSMNVQQFNSFGEIGVWNYGGADNSIAINEDDDIYFCGTQNVIYNPFPDLENYLPVHKLDTNLNTEWSYLLGGDAYYIMYSIAPAADEGCVIAATRYDSEVQNQERDVYLVGLGPDGLITSSEADSTANKNVLLYPNPGDDRIVIDTDRKKFTFKLYNSTGKKILQSRNQKTVDVSSLEAGMYFYRVISHGEIIGSGKWVKQ